MPMWIIPQKASVDENAISVFAYDECHAKIDLFEVEKFGNFSVFKFV